MNPTHFDRLTRYLATGRRSRRQTLISGGTALAGLLAGHTATAAPGATPPATPVPIDTAGTRPEFLFTQPFDAGTWAPKAGEAGTYTLTLTGAEAHTTYFSDRPARVVGLTPTQTFLDGLGFSPTNPPNAALVAQTAAGQDILVIELLHPVYDAKAATLTYDAHVLANYGKRGLAFLAQQQADDKFEATFGEGSLFIDDCADSTDADGCWVPNSYESDGRKLVGYITSGNCWSWGQGTCLPCGSYSSLCNATYTGDCYQDNCYDDISICGSPGCTHGE